MGTHRIKKSAGLAIAISFTLLVAACTRPASTPPPETGSDDGTPSGLSSQQMTMEAVRSELLTQTAQADEGGEPTATEEATAEPAGTSAPTAAPAATATPAGVPSTYTLQEGEHPYCIARRFDIDPNRLLAVNGLDASARPAAGFTLTIPQDTDGFPPPRALREHPTSYTVQPGDNIYVVACRFGDVSPQAIAQANGLSEPYQISAGTVLDIP